MSDRFTEKGRGGGGGSERYVIDRKSKSKLPHHISHLQVKLASANVYNFIVFSLLPTNQCEQFHCILAATYQHFSNDTKTFKDQTSTRTDTAIFRPSRAC